MKLFNAPRSAAHRRKQSRRERKARLSRHLTMQKCEERQLMAGDFGVSMNSNVVTIQGSDRSDQVVVSSSSPQSGRDTLEVHNHGELVFRREVGSNTRLKFLGGAGNDIFTNNSVFAASAYGQDGNDTLTAGDRGDRLFGGSGDDILVGGDGRDQLEGGDDNDLLEGGAGKDQLYGKDGNDILKGGANNDTLKGGAGEDLIWGQGGRDSIDGGGGSDRIVQDEGLVAFLEDGVLTVRGSRENAAFEFVTAGRWTESGRTISSSGLTFMNSASGHMPVGLNLDFVSDAAGRSNDAGRLKSDLAFDLSDMDYLDELDSIGMNLDGKTGFGIADGNEIREDYGAPTNIGQPYMYAAVVAPELAFGGVFSASVMSSLNTVVVADPTDPMVYVQQGDFAAGFSVQGNIPYIASTDLDYLDHEIYGHFYGRVTGIEVTPTFSIDGDILVDLDANDDGRLAIGLSDVAQLVDPSTAASAWKNVATDVAVGINGSLSAGVAMLENHKLLKHLNIGASIELGTASAVYDGHAGEFHIGGQTGNLLAGTPLEKLPFLSAQKFGIQASVRGMRTSSPDFDIVMSGEGPAKAMLHVSNDALIVGGRMDVIGQKANFHGSIAADGTIDVTGSARLSKKISLGGVIKVGVRSNFDFAYHGNLIEGTTSLEASMRISASATTRVLGSKWGLAGSIQVDVKLDPFGKDASVSGKATGSLRVYHGYGSSRVNVSAGLKLSDGGVSLRLPGVGKTVRF
jgi:hypothetical protein